MRRPTKRLNEDIETSSNSDPQEDTVVATTQLADREREKMPPYQSKVKVLEKYHIIGFISSGTYGRVYKAKSKIAGNKGEYAIKKSVHFT